MVIGNLQKNAKNAQAVIRAAVRSLAAAPPASEAHDALKYAVITPLDKAPAATLEKLDLLLKKYR
jgi:5'-methylthioadenosine phosphorylase